MENNFSKFTIKEDSIILDAIKSIQLSGSRTIIVVGKNKKVIGLISEGDILRAIIDGIDPHSSIKNIINVSFKYLNYKNMNEAFELFKLGIDILPIISAEYQLLEVLTIFDILDKLKIN